MASSPARSAHVMLDCGGCATFSTALQSPIKNALRAREQIPSHPKIESLGWRETHAVIQNTSVSIGLGFLPFQTDAFSTAT